MKLSIIEEGSLCASFRVHDFSDAKLVLTCDMIQCLRKRKYGLIGQLKISMPYFPPKSSTSMPLASSSPAGEIFVDDGSVEDKRRVPQYLCRGARLCVFEREMSGLADRIKQRSVPSHGSGGKM